MSDEKSWNAARLIPTSGISGADEQERRATSALLAVMTSVKEFGRTLLRPLGASGTHLDTFIEVPFDVNGKRIYPDGLIRTRWGQSSWTALVEVKTGANRLESEQLENYLDVARDHGFDMLITISNEIAPAPGLHPTAVDKRKLKRVRLHHWSWSEVLAHAAMQKEHRGVADPDQAWILGELIRYLEHPKSGALAFDDMGPNWVPVREAVASGTLRASDSSASEVASKFDALIRYAGLRLGRKLGTEVTPVMTKAESSDPTVRLTAAAGLLVSDGVLRAQLRVPNAVSPLRIEVDMRGSRIICSFDVDAPSDGKAKTRVNWLIRQLKEVPDTVRVEAFVPRAKTGAAELLRDIREDPAKLILDPQKEIRSFTVAQIHKLGTKRGSGQGGFIDSVLTAIDTTYEEVGQRLKAWSAAPPKMRSETLVEVEPPIALSSAALSSQDSEVAGSLD